MISNAPPDPIGNSECYDEVEYQKWLATDYVPIAGGWHY